jgi:hypothetical protein
MDINSKTRVEKDPGFHRLKTHRQRLFLNVSAILPFDTTVITPTEFYQSFLAKKSQFKANDMLTS